MAVEFGKGRSPVGPRPTVEDKQGLLAAGARMEQLLAEMGMTEDEAVAEFKRWREEKRARERLGYEA